MANSKKNPNPTDGKPELAPALLAYLNPEFLNSPDGRILRILAEYAEPLARFRREKIQDTVVFFGSARFASLPDAQQALTMLEKSGGAKPVGGKSKGDKSQEDKSQEDKSVYRDISWFDWSHAVDMSADGKLLLFDETGDGGGPNHSVYIRNLQSNSTVRVGDGQAVALSPDLKWALALNPKKPGYLNLLPIGPEASRTVSGHGLKYNWARYFPDGQRLLVAGSFPGKPLRLYVQALNGEEPVPLNPDVFLNFAIVSPDGKQIVGVGPNRKIATLPAAGGESQELAIPFPSVPLFSCPVIISSP